MKHLSNLTNIIGLSGLTLALSAGPSAALGQTTYTYHELKIPLEYTGGSARIMGVSPNSNLAVGWLSTSFPDFATLAAIWDLDDPDADPFVLPETPFQGQAWYENVRGHAINDNGEVVGAGTGLGPPGAQFGPNFLSMFHWSQTTGFKQLPMSAGNVTTVMHHGRRINNSGHIVANAFITVDPFFGGQGAAHWVPPYNQMFPHQPPGGFGSGTTLSIHGQNDADHVVGRANTPNSAPFIWGSGAPFTGYKWLGPANIFSGYANDLNNCELPWEIVGYVQYTNGGPAHAVLWEWHPTPGMSTVTFLPTLSSDPNHNSIALQINDASQITGYSTNAAGESRFVMWERNPASGDWDITDLTALLTPLVEPPAAPSWSLDEVVFWSPNNNGYIVGNATTSGIGGVNVVQHPFVLVPDQSPALTCPPPPPPPPPPPAFTLLPPTATVLANNTIRVVLSVENAPPGETVYFIDDTAGLWRARAAIQSPFPAPPASMTLGTAVADPNGEATIRTSYRASASGQTFEFVAAVLDPGDYDVQVFTLP